MAVKIVMLEDECGDDIAVHFPARWEICGRCDGDGTHVHEALSVWTGSDRDEDPDGFADMMAGHYDVCCSECHGTGKMLEIVDRDSLPLHLQPFYDQHMDALDAEADYQREVEAERRYCGYY